METEVVRMAGMEVEMLKTTGMGVEMVGIMDGSGDAEDAEDTKAALGAL